ncbi:MAG: leucine-rich repeat domain-containing protein, partial [Acutalibacteraceae bacterium]
MKKVLSKIISVFLIIVMIIGSAPLQGFVGLELPEWSEMFATKASALSDGYYTYTVSNGEATITDCDESISGDIVIPNTLGGYPVTSIGDGAFDYCTSLAGITIPNSVTSIGDSAFCACWSLTEITIPDSVTSIGEDAFQGCRSLTEITIPDSVTSIGECAFQGCDSLTSITVDSANKYYSNDGYGVLFNKDKTTLIQHPMGNSRSLYSIPYSVTSIGEYAFWFCGSLTEITIPDSVTSIGE